MGNATVGMKENETEEALVVKTVAKWVELKVFLVVEQWAQRQELRSAVWKAGDWGTKLESQRVRRKEDPLVDWQA